MDSNEANGIPPDVMADVQAIADHVAGGKPVDPQVLRRIQERAVKIRQAIFEQHGLVNIAVPAIRELRGELPER
jgi:hypothetical protein